MNIVNSFKQVQKRTLLFFVIGTIVGSIIFIKYTQNARQLIALNQCLIIEELKTTQTNTSSEEKIYFVGCGGFF